jgi:N-acetylglucosaminyl-diphospho-decaprenol L-rhamnosyltransferase
MDMGRLLDVVIVNFNSGDYLRDCIRSISSMGPESKFIRTITIVDNKSEDGSLRGIREINPEVRIIRNSVNAGFAVACNFGAAQVDGPFLLFLNPDTRLFPGALEVPLRFLQSAAGEHYGISGIQLTDQVGTPHRSCARFPTFRSLMYQAVGLSLLAPRLFPGIRLDDFSHDEDRDVDHVIGAFFLIRRRVFDELKGFDERFFLYQEDLDFSLRAKTNGWRSKFLAGARAFHKEGGSSANIKARRLFYALQSRILFAQKHCSKIEAMVFVATTLLIEPVIRILRALARGSTDETVNTVRGYLLLWRNLSTLIASGK